MRNISRISILYFCRILLIFYHKHSSSSKRVQFTVFPTIWQSKLSVHCLSFLISYSRFTFRRVLETMSDYVIIIYYCTIYCLRVIIYYNCVCCLLLGINFRSHFVSHFSNFETTVFGEQLLSMLSELINTIDKIVI